MENNRDQVIRKDEMIRNIYELAHNINATILERQDVSEYYRSVLQAIYIRTGNKEMHKFTGIVTNITPCRYNKELYNIYISNVFWNNVYVTHHVVITSSRTFNLMCGEYISFVSKIREYKDGSNYGLYNLDSVIPISKRCPAFCERSHTKLKDTQEIVDLDDELIDIAEEYCRNRALLYEAYDRLATIDYEEKRNLYQRLMNDSITFNEERKLVPDNYYNVSIHSLFYRQQEEVLCNKIIDIFPEENDLDDILMTQIFVKWLTQKITIVNPGEVFFNIVKFIISTTSYRLKKIAKKNKLSFKVMVRTEDNIFKNFLNKNDRHLFQEGHLLEFNKYAVDFINN